MEQMRLFDHKSKLGRIPLTPARIALAVLSGLIGASGLYVSGLHRGGIDGSFEYGPAEIATTVVAILVILSGTFAASRAVRLLAYAACVLAIAWFGASTMAGRLLVGGVTIAAGLVLPALARSIIGTLRRRKSRPNGPAEQLRLPIAGSTTFALVAVIVGPALVLLAATPSAHARAGGLSCAFGERGIGEFSLFEGGPEGPEIDLEDGRLVLELSGDDTTYTFVARTALRGDVVVVLDQMKPLAVRDDVLVWAGQFNDDSAESYSLFLRRSGWFGVYELHFDSSDGQIVRPPVPVVPGQATLRATFTARDSETAAVLEQCSIDLEIVVEAEPYTTLAGLGSIGAAAAAASTIRPLRRVASAAFDAAFVHRLSLVSAKVNGKPQSGRALQTVAGQTSTFRIKFSVKLSHDEEQVKKWQQADVRAIGFGDLVKLLELKPAIGVTHGVLSLDVAGSFKAGDKDGTCRVQLEVTCGSEKTTEEFDVLVGGADVIDVRRVDPSATATGGRDASS